MESNPISSPTIPQADPRQALLEEAARCVTKDRNSTYDEPEDNFARIADYWNLYLGGQLVKPIAPYQVAWIMALVKVARDQFCPHHDNRVDMAGYMACAEQVVVRAGQAREMAPLSPGAASLRLEQLNRAFDVLHQELDRLVVPATPA